MTALKQQTVTSVKWNAVSQVFRLSLYFLTSVILARLLQPEDFGLLGMATVFTSLVAVFNDFGLGSAVIQKTDPDRNTLSTVFWLTVIIGLLATAVTILAAPLIASFYGQEKLQPLLTLLSVSFLLTALGQIQLSLLMKRIRFKHLAVVESGSVLLGSVTAILLAVWGQGVWALAFQLVVTSGTATILLWITTAWHPGLNFQPGKLREVLTFSSGVFGFNFLNYFSRNADYFLIGKFLGAGPLGLYTFAYRLMQFPIQNIAGVVNRVLFPTLAQVKENDEQFKRGYIQASRMIALVTFPLMVGVLCLARELTLVVFGVKWQPAIPIIQILALIGLIQSLGSMVGNIFMAKGKTDWLFYWGILSSILIVTAIVIGMRWGIVGVAAGYACAALFLVIPNLAIPFHLIGLKVSTYFVALKMQIGLTVLMGLIVFLSASIQRTLGWSQVIVLASNVLLGGGVYILSVARFDRSTFEEVLGLAFGNNASRILKFFPS